MFHVSVMGFILSDVWISPVHVRIPRETLIKHPVNSKGFGFHIYFVGIKERSSLVRCEFCVADLLQVHDRAQVFVSCSAGVRTLRYCGVIERWSNKTLEIPNLRCSSKTSLYILVIFLAFSSELCF